MQEIIEIDTISKNYQVIISTDSFIQRIKEIQKEHLNCQITIITDKHLEKLYSHYWNKLKIDSFSIEAGELSKNIENKIAIERFLFSQSNDRNSILIALGGGVIGDLVGFCAATFMRGIRFYSFASSIIAMVDSSIGGKTGIDNEFGKNLIGSFYHPEEVYIDLNFIQTLPSIEYLNGLAEILKYAFIKDVNLFHFIENNIDLIKSKDLKIITYLIKESIRIKRDIVSIDEKENGIRRILNFGHTIGHAIELLTNFAIKHGFAVSIGMAVEAFFSVQLNLLSQEDFNKIIKILLLLNLPIFSVEVEHLNDIDIYNIMLNDKKSYANKVYFNALKKIGFIEENNRNYRTYLSQDNFLNYFKAFKREFKIML